MKNVFNFCFVALLLGSISSITLLKQNVNLTTTAKVSTLQDLLTWGQSKGALVSNFTFKSINVNNRYVVATKDIKKNEIIAEFPLSMLITAENPIIRAQCKFLETIYNVDDLNYKKLCIILFNHLQIKNPLSEFKPYVDNLPKHFPLLYSNLDNKLRTIIKRSLLEEHALAKLEEVKQTFEKIKNLIPITFEEFVYAFNSVDSRSFDITKSDKTNFVTSIPVFDMLNHRSVTPAITHKYNEERKVMEIISLKDFKKDEELYISYFELMILTNNELVNYFGFASNDNRFSPKIDLEINEVNIELHLPIALKLETIAKLGNSETFFEKSLLNGLQSIKSLIADRLSRYSSTYEEDLKSFKKEKDLVKDVYAALLDEKEVLNENLYFVNEMIKFIEKNKIERVDIRLKLLLSSSNNAVEIFEKVRNSLSS